MIRSPVHVSLVDLFGAGLNGPGDGDFAFNSQRASRESYAKQGRYYTPTNRADLCGIKYNVQNWFKEVPHSVSYFVVKVLAP